MCFQTELYKEMLEDVFEARAGMPRGATAAAEPHPGNPRISKSFHAVGRLLNVVLEQDDTKTGCRAVQHFA